MNPPIEVTELLGHYVILIDKSFAPLIVLVAAVLGLACAWLANRPQPTPHWEGVK